ncbi:MAG TPA: hypothetical protein VMZ92_06380 [Planctomycetota bacterium]|nr:hypothetical protein [Planctomycetota bacterium]
MRLTLTGWTLTVAVLAATLTPVWAEGQQPMNSTASGTNGREVKFDRSKLKVPWDFAPPEQIVSGRDTMDFRREGTLLAKASREIPQVDQAGLAERKYAMYEGRRFYQGPTRSAEEMNSPRALAARRKLATAAIGAPEGGSGWFGWTLLTVVVAAVLVAWRMGWFVPFSERAAEEKRASRAASGKRRGRGTKGPRIELRRRG